MAGFSTGDHVVYPPHGAGTIVTIAARDGQDYLSIRITHSKMTLMVPADIAAEKGVRPVVSKKQADALLKKLKEPGTELPDNPQHRNRQISDQARVGGVDELSDMLRDLASRTEDGKKLSAAEMKIRDNARQMLASEIALAKGIEEQAAFDAIDKALERG